MNDRFKFRAWNIIAKKMYYSTYTEPLVIGGDEHWAIKGFADDANSLLMQCTGLKDMNGALIYEGDIVLNNYLHWEIWHEGAIYYMISKGQSKILEPCETGREASVVGNICENPELMGGGNV